MRKSAPRPEPSPLAPLPGRERGIARRGSRAERAARAVWASPTPAPGEGDRRGEGCDAAKDGSRIGRKLFLLFALLLAAAPLGASEVVHLPHLEATIWDQAVPGSSFREEIVQGLLDAPPERIFRAVTDWEHYAEWMPFVARSQAQPPAGGAVVSFQAMKLPAPMGERHYRIRAVSSVAGEGAARRWQAGWAYVPGSGNVKDHHGTWTLAPAAGGKTTVVCRLFTDPGGAVPAWAMHRALAATLPYILDGLRQQVERSRYGG
jgi:uncharacterized protein YndB with AHSA1/START domain